VCFFLEHRHPAIGFCFGYRIPDDSYLCDEGCWSILLGALVCSG
jgi:hypothetical protein